MFGIYPFPFLFPIVFEGGTPPVPPTGLVTITINEVLQNSIAPKDFPATMIIPTTASITTVNPAVKLLTEIETEVLP